MTREEARFTLRGPALTALALLAAACLASCGHIEDPQVALLGLEYVSVGNAGINFILNADVTNPNSFDATLSRFDYDVFIDGTKLAHGFRPDDVLLATKSTVRVGVPFTVTWEGLKEGLAKFVDDKEHDWKLTGSVVLKKGGLFKTFTFDEAGRFGGPVGGPLKVRGETKASE